LTIAFNEHNKKRDGKNNDNSHEQGNGDDLHGAQARPYQTFPGF